MITQFQDLKIDRRSAVPLYAQFKEYFRNQITSHQLAPGTQLPAEDELTAMAGLSRYTVRQALDELTQQGFIVRIRGKGTFVSERKVPLSVGHKLIGFSQDLSNKGYVVESQILESDLAPASEEIAEALHVVPSTPIVRIKRLRLIDSQPFLVDVISVRSDLCPGLEGIELTDGSLYRTFKARYGFTVARARRTLRAIAAEAWVARHLAIEEGAPVHCLTDLAFLDDGTPIEFATAITRGDSSEFVFDLVKAELEVAQPAGGSTNPVPSVPPEHPSAAQAGAAGPG
jgi:GntR family transcriptional regulator